jgi:hypothetical protein
MQAFLTIVNFRPLAILPKLSIVGSMYHQGFQLITSS